MVALNRAGRSSEALAVYADIRRLLNEELGVEPGERLRDLHRLILPGSGPGPGTPRAGSGSGSAPGTGRTGRTTGTGSRAPEGDPPGSANLPPSCR
ncbi:hypothetical protein GCM10018952_36450 [Streptosporangium vulgare]